MCGRLFQIIDSFIQIERQTETTRDNKEKVARFFWQQNHIFLFFAFSPGPFPPLREIPAVMNVNASAAARVLSNPTFLFLHSSFLLFLSSFFSIFAFFSYFSRWFSLIFSAFRPIPSTEEAICEIGCNASLH